MKPDTLTGIVWHPFDRTVYSFKIFLSEEERAAISTPQRRSAFINQISVPPLLQPFFDIAQKADISEELTKRTLQAVLAEMARRDQPCNCWNEEIWQGLYQNWRISGPLLSAWAFHFADIPFPLYSKRFRQPAHYAKAAFGRDFFQQELNRLLEVLVALGYSRRTQEMFLSAALGMLMLENGDPRLESFTEELLKRGQQYRTEGIARAIGKVSHGLAAMGILSRPLRMRGYIGWKEKQTDGIAAEWVGWCQRWRETSVLRPQTRESI